MGVGCRGISFSDPPPPPFIGLSRGAASLYDRQRSPSRSPSVESCRESEYQCPREREAHLRASSAGLRAGSESQSPARSPARWSQRRTLRHRPSRSVNCWRFFVLQALIFPSFMSVGRREFEPPLRVPSATSSV